MESVRIVLVNTSHPGNIGAAARAMKNMGLAQLYLVSPESYPHAEATARASGADNLLADAVVCRSLEEALVGTNLVVGLSARPRNLSCEQLSLRESAAKTVEIATSGQTAFVFGRERTGLLNEELDLCHYLVHIPTNPDFSSLNVAAAVQVVSYELRMAFLEAVDNQGSEVELPSYADSDAVERLYAHLENIMIKTEFLNPDNPRLLMRRVRRLFNRARLEQDEVQILRGLLTSIEKKL
ncbi:tRNA (cytosine(32)/uridine(32)-2'-O)-methyltransferase TrmJ [Solemya pervernicosa gill symbiont]|uniref:tRNA (cytidine/uridine-2'-O-)-methyltransferase TrmJ n=2 Tax=Gammaproteobacteria incertae sedis TaxID=118884 RepID=A0A1T2LB02_9GAMM|nr:RNA methyltransferase [Candidatus Reidiella endopervernicosa]OOZ42182.1 tRNA (cytosine(32)/uridine(32)-2'-O)-methyltransferase TrmJ [Solemya pervernicosa gill symbiont]QKQ27249.1 RNA methyltransferase [Candidatus Reidiella endopervernicosa]